MGVYEDQLLTRLLERVTDRDQSDFLRQSLQSLPEASRKLILVQLTLIESSNMFSLIGLQAAINANRIQVASSQNLRINQSVNVNQTAINASLTRINTEFNITIRLVRQTQTDLDSLRRLIEDRLNRLGLDILSFRGETLQVLDSLLLRTSNLLLKIDRMAAEVRRTKQAVGEVKNVTEEIKNTINNDIVEPLREVRREVSELLTLTQEQILPELNLIKAGIRALEEALAVFAEGTSLALSGLSGEVSGLYVAIAGAVSELTALIIAKDRGLANQITGVADQLGELKELFQQQREEIRHLGLELPDNVAEVVVGESYYRFDSTSNYLPTVIFLFTLEEGSPGAGRSQIKLRYPKVTSEVTELDIAELQARAQTLQGLSYVYGDTRLNFVAADRKAKTVLNVGNAQEGLEVIRRVCEVVGVAFDEGLVTQTTGNRRPPVGRRLEPIGDWEPRPNKNINGRYRLIRAKFYLNGMAKPKTIYSIDEN